jgi:hypothetical protein
MGFVNLGNLVISCSVGLDESDKIHQKELMPPSWVHGEGHVSLS